MSKKMKTLIFGGAFVLLLVGALIFLLQTKPVEDDVVSTTSTTPTYTLIEENVDNFAGLTVKNQSTELEVLPKEIVIESTEEGVEDTVITSYSVTSLEAYPQSDTLVKSLVTTFSVLKASDRVFEVVENKADYGLETPQATLTISFTDGAESILYLGDYNQGKNVYYAMVEGDEALYTIPQTAGDKLVADEFTYLNKSLLPIFDQSNQESVIPTGLSIDRPDLDAPIVLGQYDGGMEASQRVYMSILYMFSPVVTEVNNDVDTEFLPGVFGMNATQVVDFYDESKAAEYGFDVPSMTLVLDYQDINTNEYTDTVVVGKATEDGGHYVLFNENGLVYNVSDNYLGLLGVDEDDFVSTLPLLPNITTVGTVDLLLDGVDYEFVLTSELKDPEDPESIYQVVNVTLGDGTPVDLEHFKKFYQLLLTAAVDEINTDAIEGQPDMKITYNYYEGGSDSLACYVVNENRRTQILINDVPIYGGRAGFVEKTRTELDHLLSGEKVDTDW